MKVEARHGNVVFTQYIAEEQLTREEAAQYVAAIALAITNAGDIGDPQAQFFMDLVHRAVHGFLKGRV